MGVRIDVSGEKNLRIVTDDVSVSPVKAVRGLRKVTRQRYTRDLISDKSHQGVVATGISLKDKSKDMTRLVSCHTPLSFRHWRYLHRARLNILPLRSHSWFCSQGQDTSCRRCGKENKTKFHVLKHYEEVKQGQNLTINNAIPGQSLRPDVEFQLSGSRVIVDVVVCYDQPGRMDNAYQRKYDKYSSHGRILPLLVGSLGSWYPRNDEIHSILGINGRSWGYRLAGLQRSMEMVCAHFHHGATNPEAEEIPPVLVETPYPVTE
ncbi:Uncharacterized protein APZ42_025554 [Daphnia magna]|uniref:Uncharacterized protein n=1 Tax=Daphnia magna TaxID=35525 RepID=A0A164SYG2_9CRUS|nr:Uncharacterized protein APZ42_025554 [Daphnia magna]